MFFQLRRQVSISRKLEPMRLPWRYNKRSHSVTFIDV